MSEPVDLEEAQRICDLARSIDDRDWADIRGLEAADRARAVAIWARSALSALISEVRELRAEKAKPRRFEISKGAAALLAVPCARCGSPVGEWCHTTDALVVWRSPGLRTSFHKARVDAARGRA